MNKDPVFINLCNHEVVLCNAEGEPVHVYAPSGNFARMPVSWVDVAPVGDIPLAYRDCEMPAIFTIQNNAQVLVGAFPEPQPGVYLIVSNIVLRAMPHRDDLVAPTADPAGLFRNEGGFVRGVLKFDTNRGEKNKALIHSAQVRRGHERRRLGQAADSADAAFYRQLELLQASPDDPETRAQAIAALIQKARAVYDYRSVLPAEIRHKSEDASNDID